MTVNYTFKIYCFTILDYLQFSILIKEVASPNESYKYRGTFEIGIVVMRGHINEIKLPKGEVSQLDMDAFNH